MVTIQFNLTVNMKVFVREKSFATEALCEKWLEKMGDRVQVLRYSFSE